MHNYSMTMPLESWRVCRTTTQTRVATTSSVCGKAMRKERSPGRIPVGPSGVSRSLEEADFLTVEFEASPHRTSPQLGKGPVLPRVIGLFVQSR